MRHLSKTYLPLNKDQLLFTTLINYLLLLYHFRRSHLYVPHSPVAIWAHIRTHTCTRTCWPFTFSSVQVRKCLKTSESATTGWLHIRSIHSCSWRSRWFTKSSSNRPESKSSKHSLIKIKDFIQKSNKLLMHTEEQSFQPHGCQVLWWTSSSQHQQGFIRTRSWYP